MRANPVRCELTDGNVRISPQSNSIAMIYLTRVDGIVVEGSGWLRIRASQACLVDQASTGPRKLNPHIPECVGMSAQYCHILCSKIRCNCYSSSCVDSCFVAWFDLYRKRLRAPYSAHCRPFQRDPSSKTTVTFVFNPLEHGDNQPSTKPSTDESVTNSITQRVNLHYSWGYVSIDNAYSLHVSVGLFL